MGHYVSSVIGGAVGRTAAGRTRPRASERTEPLTGRGQRLGSEVEQEPSLGGNRLGGRRGRNRLVQPEVQATIDPQIGERTQWIIPPESTNMERTQRYARRTVNEAVDNVRQRAAAISDAVGGAVENVRQRISGRNPTPRRGTCARLTIDEPALQRRRPSRFIIFIISL